MVDWKKLKRHIPHRVQMNKNTYFEVLWVESFKDTNILGEMRLDHKQIVIKKGMSPKLTVTVFLHECCHAVSDLNNIKLTENQIQALESSFYYLLKPGNVFSDKKGIKDEE